MRSMCRSFNTCRADLALSAEWIVKKGRRMTLRASRGPVSSSTTRTDGLWVVCSVDVWVPIRNAPQCTAHFKENERQNLYRPFSSLPGQYIAGLDRSDHYLFATQWSIVCERERALRK